MTTYNVVHAVFATGSDLLTATVERGTSVTGPWTLIGQMSLSGDAAPPVVDEGYYYDNTAPFDTAVWYRVSRYLATGALDAQVIVGPLTLTGNGNVVLSDPLRPWADLEFSFCETPQQATAALCDPTGPDRVWTRFGDRNRAVDAGLFNVLDAEHPADVYARRKDHSGTGRFLTKSLAAVDAVYDLFTAGGPLYLRAPAAYGRTDFALQPGDLGETFLTDRIDQRLPLRTWNFPYVVVDAPLGPQQGPDCANWCAVKTAFPTFADLTVTGDTWRDVASGATLCPEGVEDGFGLGPYGGGPYGDGG
jgi:hypothetical protein